MLVGTTKPLHFNENKHLYTQYASKLVHVIVNELPPVIKSKDTTKLGWENDHYLRDCVAWKGIDVHLPKLPDDAVIILNDADEIPTRHVVHFLRCVHYQSVFVFVTRERDTHRATCVVMMMLNQVLHGVC